MSTLMGDHRGPKKKTEVLSKHRYFLFNTSEEVLSKASKNQAKIPTENCIRGALSSK